MADDWHLIDQLLLLLHKNNGSDLIVKTGDRIRMKLDGRVVSIPPEKVPPPTHDQVVEMIEHLVRKLPNPPKVEGSHNIDCQYSLENVSHFRIHAMATARSYGIVARRIPQEIPNFEKMQLPPVLNEIADNRNGLILVGGATGSGKSTTLAAMLYRVIQRRPVHVVTLEDPIEFRYPFDCPGTVTQREVGTDLVSYEQGLNDCLREAPDIILAGEVREKNVIQLALTAAETGHLVAATVHATTAIGTIQRMMGAFPPEEQHAFIERMAESLRAIIVQKLLPRKSGKGRVAAMEILIANAVIRQFILDWEEKAQEIPRALEEGHRIYGTQSFDQHLQMLVEDGVVSYEDAYANAVFPEDFEMRMGRN
ncbi:MAG: PilT/PilU family type 4a pilus ATPase [Zetaproteobacteria bacterium]|nr:MAG: PilT/PilU family type 4a pilus ATPase [Zetaproteobacteria bacterium]